MTKLKFLLLLNDKLSGLPEDDVQERLSFYSEMIEDRMEEGLSEEEAVSAIGSIDEIAAQIIAEIAPFKTAFQEEKPKKHSKVLEIVLIVLGSPIWLSLLIAAFAVVISLYVSLWAVIISLWAVFASLVGCALGGLVAGLGFILFGNHLTGIAMIGAGIVCVGLSIFLFCGCKAATNATLVLTMKIPHWIKNAVCTRRKRHA